LDELDRQILDLLLRNCRISYRDIGKKVNLSASAVKNRVDNLENSGLIHEFGVTLHPEHINVRYATILVNTDASIKISTFGDTVMSFEGVYMILPLIDGNFYVSIEYSKETDLQDFCKFVSAIPGVQDSDVYDVLPPGEKLDLPEIPDFTRNELFVLSQLVINPRMQDHEIAASLGWPTKKVKPILHDLETGNKVAFGVRWNPNLGYDLAFNLIVKYNAEQTSPSELMGRMNEEFPEIYLASRVVESRSTVFAVCTAEKVVDIEPLAMAVLAYPGIRSCYAITYYNAILGKTLSETRLVKLLEKEGLWPSKLQ
jgi:DNA-binding Lrp family transcriptional regulator